MNQSAHFDVWERLTPATVEAGDEESDEQDTGHGSPSIFEQVYSVSEKLFRLIGRAVALALKVGGSHVHSTDQLVCTSKEISELEDAICSWKNDSVAQEPATAASIRNSSRADVQHYFQNAIHSALLVYFYKCVQVIDTYTVQPYVQKTILQLQFYTEAKRQTNDQSSSICWPAFVTACEALDLDLRQSFSQWFLSESARTGIQMFVTARTAVERVWDARDRSKNRNLPWSEILQSDNFLDQLMLS